MKQRKTMKLWQMLALAGICLGLLINMFLPLWDVNGTKLVDWIMSEADEIAATQEMTIGQIKELQDKIEEKKENKEELEKLAEQYDDEIEKIEEKMGIDICSLSGIGFVTMDANALLLGDKEYTEEDLERLEEGVDGEQFKEYRQKMTQAKWKFVGMYFGETVLLILILIGFFLKWDKRIVSIISILHGLGTVTNYASEWWGTPGYMMNSIKDEELVEKLEPLIESFWASVVGIGIIVGFILGILLLVMGIISCFVGIYGDPIPDGPPFPPVDPPFPPVPPFPPQPQPWPQPQPEPQPQPQPEPIPVKPKYGRVKCTQGVAMGQGFKLPEDRKVIIGKSPQNATLVIHDPHISNVHCSVRYRAETDSYIVKDHSTNGTFVHGVRLGKDVAMEYPAGTVLSLADGTNKVLLG